MQCAILLSSPDPHCFFLPHPPHNVVLSCARSHLFNLLFFHVALFYFLFSFYNFIMKIRVPLFFSICSTIRTLDSSLVEGRHTSLAFVVNRTLSYSRANQDGVYWMYRLWVIFPFIPSSFSPLFFSSLLLRHPSFALPASEPGASDQMEFFHFIFPTLCTDIKFHRSRFCPCAVFHVHTRTFSSSLELSVKPNLHGLLWMFIPSELSRERKWY